MFNQEVISEGISIAIAGYLIVFLALVSLYYVFSFLNKLLTKRTKRKLTKSGKTITDEKELHISGEVTAAISMAVFLSQELHDKESDVLTIKRISRTYSPWNSRIYGMRFFRR
jgi:Na+-transporting methylmalonyl-CoA/oxaloacetate decarboxylase gamma subunit